MNRKDSKNIAGAPPPVRIAGEPRSRYEYACNDAGRSPAGTEQGLQHTLPEATVETWARAVVNAAYAVYRALESGSLKSVYEEALCLELQAQSIPFVRRAPISGCYRKQIAGEGRAVLLIGEQIIVELKAVDALLPIHSAQVTPDFNGR